MQRMPLLELNGAQNSTEDQVIKLPAAAEGAGAVDPASVGAQQVTLPPVAQPWMQPLPQPMMPGMLQAMLHAPLQQPMQGLWPQPQQMPSGPPILSLPLPLGLPIPLPVQLATATPAGLNPAVVTGAGLYIAGTQQLQQQVIKEAAGTQNAAQDAEGGKEDADSDEDDEEEEEEEQEDDESDWKQLLWHALHASARPSRFACSGRLQAPWLCPDLSVSGVGRLGLPLSREQAATLKAAAEQAPHGKGLRTVVDTAVRDAFQVDASQVAIASSWQPLLQSAVTAVARALDLNDSAACSIEARLYKLLLYEQGGHFAAHQDTEKERGMIGTLVVQLPCVEGHTGGSLTVRHKGLQFTHHFAQDSATTVQYAAFFADCEHDLSPVLSGMRLALVYNLVWVGAPAAAPRLVNKSPAEIQLKRALRAWENDIAEGGKQKRIAFLLEHKYTESNLCFEHLKGADRALVRAMSTCRGLEAHLVLVTRKVSGTAESSGWGCRYKRRCYYDDDDEEEEEEDSDDEGPHTMADVHEDETSTGDWVARDGSTINHGSIDPEVDFYDPEDNELFGSDDDPDDEEYEGFTGNAGPTLDQIYYRTLLVLWPRSQTLANAKHAGFTAMLSILNIRMEEATSMHYDDTGEAADQPGSSSSSKRLQATHADVLAALKACVEHLEKQLAQPQQAAPTFYYHSSSSSRVSLQHMVPVMEQGVEAVNLGIEGAAGLVQRLLTAVASSPQSVLTDTALPPALAAAATALGAAAVGPPLQQLVNKCMPTQPGSCIAVIEGLSAAQELQQQLATAALAAAPATLVDHLVKLILALPGLPAVQQQVVDKLVAAVQGDQSAGIASKVAALLSQLDQLPKLQQQLASPTAEALCAAGPLVHINSILQLLGIKAAQPQLQEQVGAAVATKLRQDGGWQASSMLQLVGKLQRAAGLQKLLRAEIAASIFASSTILANQTDESMLQLSNMLLQTAELCSAHYSGFAAAVAERRGNFDLLKQLLQSQLLQAASVEQKQLIDHVCAALRRRTHTWQLSEAMPLLEILSGVAALQQMVRATIAECMFTNSHLLSSQTDDSMLQLSGMLLSHKQLKAAYYDVFADVVVKRRNNYNLLKQLLQSAPVRSALPMPEVQQLVSCQVANLERMSAVPPFSWHMPQAKLSSYPEVESFLRGPNSTFTLTGFSGIADARKAANRLQGADSYYRYGSWGNNSYTANTSTYSLQALATGTGKNARVSITKTKQWYESMVKGKEPVKQELQAVKAMRR